MSERTHGDDDLSADDSRTRVDDPMLDDGPPTTPPVPVASPGSFALAAVVLGVAAYLTHGLVTMQVPEDVDAPGPRFFPVIVVVIAYALAVLLAVQAVRGRAALGALSDRERADVRGPDADWRAVGLVIATFVVFLVLLDPLGWLLSGALLFWGVAISLGSRRWTMDAGIALAVSSIVQLAFSAGLGLNLPAGILGGF